MVQILEIIHYECTAYIVLTIRATLLKEIITVAYAPHVTSYVH